MAWNNVFEIREQSKVILAGAVYVLSDYFYSRDHFTKRLQHPVPASVSLFSHSVLLGMVYCYAFKASRKLHLPEISIPMISATLAMSILLRFNVFDLNHNFGEPSYKQITSLMLPLLLMYYGSNPKKCSAVFICMLMSNMVGQHFLSVNQMLLGAALCLTPLVCFYMTQKYIRSTKEKTELFSKDQQFLTIAKDFITGVVIWDFIFMLLDSQTSITEYVELGWTGTFLLSFANFGKMMVMFVDCDLGINSLMVNWIMKTLMFSATYTLGFKFDLTIGNLIAIVSWVLFNIGSFVMDKFSRFSEPQLGI